MRLNDFIRQMEHIAPPELAMEWDNPGLLISPENEDIHTVLIALDCTVQVAEEAVETKADLVLTHHPLFFSAVKHIRKDDPDTAAAWILLRHGIGLYAAHTNLDAADGGVNDVLMKMLGAGQVQKLQPDGLGRIGVLAEETTLSDFAGFIEGKLHARILVSGDPDAKVKTVACIGGAGADDMLTAAEQGADVFVTGEAKHHEGIRSNISGIPLIVAGHYETECVVLEPLAARLQDMTNDVQYKIALSDNGPYWHR